LSCGFNGILKIHNFSQFYKLQIPEDINKRGVKREQKQIFYGFRWFAPSFCSLFNTFFHRIFIVQYAQETLWYIFDRCCGTYTTMYHNKQKQLPLIAPKGNNLATAQSMQITEK
jgi:hypothetical protein